MKRGFDIAFAALALFALIPLLVIVAVAITLDSRGPLLFRQRRYGRDMKPFTVLKFRTMSDGAPADAHRNYIASLAAGEEDDAPGLKKLIHDPRVTRVGHLLRRFSLDELPQFANVLGGTMSLIGPRPAIDYEVEHYLPRHYERFAVRPGLSGLWQVSGRSEIGFNEMLDLDVEYAHNCSFSTDLRVFVRTPLAMVRGAA
jgi:lipopolysaccharide/colanic/teichoic acid biosynthesis glycosyltransferase